MGARTIHPFPARMAPDIALTHLKDVGQGPLTILDPMCGSGTVLGAASSTGHTAIGFDVDPLAVLMSSVATAALDLGAFEREAITVVRRARLTAVSRTPWEDDETEKFASYWFGASQRSALARLVTEIGLVEDASVRNALKVALSRIIVTKSPKASLAADTSHSRPHRVILDSDYDVTQGFLASASSLGKLLMARSLVGPVSVYRGDSRSLAIGDGSVDITITSPPYLNAIDYLRGHKMSLIWFGYSIADLRAIRSHSIGAERALDGKAEEQAQDLVHLVTESVPFPDLLPTATITRYAQDLISFAREQARVLRNTGKIVTVIGNSTLRGNYIPNDLLVQRSYEFAGFTLVDRFERQLPENRRYLPLRSSEVGSSIAKRMRSEIVLTMEK